MSKVLVYGAYGYTGKLIVDQALKEGLHPTIAGRNKEKIEKLAKETDLDYRYFDLTQGDLKLELKEFDLVVHAAGPFKFTARRMVEACLASKTHYMDITGEIEVFELCHNYDQQAKDAGIMILPGAGMDVVPSDCLAMHLKQLLPDATYLQLAFGGGAGFSRGTARSVVENLGLGGAIRKDHKIKVVPTGHETKRINFNGKSTLTVAIPWGDVSTAYYSTGIPNIVVYTQATEGMVRGMKMSNYVGWLLRSKVIRNYLKKQIDNRPPGPSAKKRNKSVTHFWGRVRNESGEEKISTQITPEGYTLTALTVVAAVQKIMDGNFKTGFQTPSTVFGADFILEIEGCSRKDL